MAREESPFRRLSSDFAANPTAVFGLILLGIIVIAALAAPLISPQNPYDLAQLDVVSGRLPPGSTNENGATFWLGTDDQGRDMLSAIFYGLRISLMVGVASTVVALAIGLALGLVAAPLLLLLLPESPTYLLAALSPAIGFLALLPPSAPLSGYTLAYPGGG